MNEGKKNDANKPRWSLLPTVAIQSVIDVLEYGANKYTTPVSDNPCDAYLKLAEYCTCQNNIAPPVVTPKNGMRLKDYAPVVTSNNTRKQSEQRAIPIESPYAQGCVASATIESSKKIIQNTHSDSEVITRRGRRNILRRSKLGDPSIIANLEPKQKHVMTHDYVNSPPLDFLSKTGYGSLNNKKDAAPFAKNYHKGALSTSTTITPPDVFEASSAGVATKDSVSWETVSKALQEHSNICHAQAVLFVRDEKLWRSGAGNWRYVKNLRTRYYDAAMRHIHAWWLGEQTDQESGHHHLAHACCCIVFLLTVDLEAKKK